MRAQLGNRIAPTALSEKMPPRAFELSAFVRPDIQQHCCCRFPARRVIRRCEDSGVLYPQVLGLFRGRYTNLEVKSSPLSFKRFSSVGIFCCDVHFSSSSIARRLLLLYPRASQPLRSFVVNTAFEVHSIAIPPFYSCFRLAVDLLLLASFG